MNHVYTLALAIIFSTTCLQAYVKETFQATVAGLGAATATISLSATKKSYAEFVQAEKNASASRELEYLRKKICGHEDAEKSHYYEAQATKAAAKFIAFATFTAATAGLGIWCTAVFAKNVLNALSK